MPQGLAFWVPPNRDGCNVTTGTWSELTSAKVDAQQAECGVMAH